MWRAPNGARLRFAYLERDADAEGYQGHSYTGSTSRRSATSPPSGQSSSSWPLCAQELAFLWDLELPAIRVDLGINGSRLGILILLPPDGGYQGCSERA
jgi:hypothetical protein